MRNPDSAEILAASVQVEAGKNFITQVNDTTGVPVPQCVPAVTRL